MGLPILIWSLVRRQLGIRLHVQYRRGPPNNKDEAAGQLAAITGPRPSFAGLSMDRVQVMGIVNVTPDSFSDGGRFFGAEDAIAHGCGMVADGAALLDVGGESTRPRAELVSTEDELARITPVVSALAKDGYLVSADTRHSAVMGPALAAGARIINSVSGFTDEGAAEVMAQAYLSAPASSFAIAMHMQGTPQTMQDYPEYCFAPIEVFDVLARHIDRLVAAGLPNPILWLTRALALAKHLPIMQK